MICLERKLSGSILDIGGGGEGVIGRLYGRQVVAIDISREELEEAPGGFEKVVMDAADLSYDNESFDHVTFFYSLMYMTADDQRKAIREAFRVVKAGGSLCIWDCEIPRAYPEPFLAELLIRLPDQKIRTTYGVVKLDSQSFSSVAALCRDAGFHPVVSSHCKEGFYFQYKKQGEGAAHDF